MAGPVCEVADAARRMDGVVCGPGAGLWPGEGCRAWLRACPAVAPEGAAVQEGMGEGGRGNPFLYRDQPNFGTFPAFIPPLWFAAG